MENTIDYNNFIPEKDIHICSVRINELTDIQMICLIVNQFYKKTGNKLSINYIGSKGYLYCIQFDSEGQLSDNNRITYDKFKSRKYIHIYYSKYVKLYISNKKL